MSTRSLKRLSALKKSRKFRDRSRKESRRLHLEQLEDRRVMAIFVLPNNGDLLNDGQTRTIAPKDLTFRFTDVPGINPTTIASGIRLTRAGQDGSFGQANDVVVSPGFIGIGDTDTEVVMRFAETLPDDTYRITIVGTGTNPLRDSSGVPINNGTDFNLNFRLDLGAQVIAVVPQPIRRNASGGLEMTEIIPGNPTPRSTQNIVYVYFNNDDLTAASATRPEFYRLYITRNTLDPADDTEILPTSVEYDPVTNLAKLIFGQASSLDALVANDGSRDPSKSFRLRIGTNEVRRALTTVTRLGTQDPGSSFATARDLASSVTLGVQGASVAFAQAIEAQPYNLDWPGGTDEPGHRDIPFDEHIGDDDPAAAGGLNSLADTVDGVTTVFYNFRPQIGIIPGGVVGSQPAFNLITENQKQRAREVFELYSKYSGVQFVEDDGSNPASLIIATGDMRAVVPPLTSGPGGTRATSGINASLQPIAVLDNGEIWNDQYGENWFQTAMHEIGHLLDLGHTYDLPPITTSGSSATVGFNSPAPEPVFPGDHVIAHMRHLYRPEGRDIDLYRFVLDGTGVLTVETFAERLSDSSNLDTHLRLYREGAGGVIEEIARNDDYFSRDSLLQLTLGQGTYYIGVSAAGNEQYDPTIVDSGMGGTTQGVYELKLDFRKNASETLVDVQTVTGVIPDALNVAFDGDADGAPGGVYNFWFRAAPNSISSPPSARARTIFVDKVAPAGGNGLLSAPFRNIDDALDAARPFDIVRIVGNDPLANNGTTSPSRLADDRAYQLGFDDFGSELPDGSELAVPKDVTVMIDAGAIFQMRRSQVSVGSTSPSINSDRSGGALQVLGTPTTSVYFTSYNEGGPNSIGFDQNTLANPPAAGDWGGLSFVNDLDRADGRFDHEAVGVFLNYVNHADIRFGGGQVNVNSLFQVVTPINMFDRRPTITFNTITQSADAAMAANPDSFEETNFQAPRYWPTFSSDPTYNPSQVTTPPPSSSYTLDYDRVGPQIHGNVLLRNSTNAIFVRTRTPAGNVLEEMTVAGRFDDTDIVHVIQENLVVRGTPGGATLEQTAPPINLIISNIIPGQQPFGFTAPPATNLEVEYKLVYIDLLGNEGLASETFSVFIGGTSGIPAGLSGVGVQLTQLPNPASPNPEFVARRLYRRTYLTGSTPTGPFTLVDQIPASVTEYLDLNLPVSGALQTLKVLSTPLSVQRPRLDASLVIDPTMVLKSDGSRIDVGVGANLIAEGFAGQEIVFTSLSDDRYGAGGTFDNNNDNQVVPVVTTTVQGSAAQNEVQTVSVPGNPAVGAFTLTFNGRTTVAIPFGASAATVQAALEGLANINPGDVSVTLASNIWTITFTGTLAAQNVAELIPNSSPIENEPAAGDWGGLFFSADSKGSVDNAVFAYGGGLNRIEGTFAGFNVIEIHQAEVRVTQSKFEFNDPGQGGQAPIDRFGRGFNRPGTIFVRGAQPIVFDNVVIDNAGPFINIDVNALNSERVVDSGRMSGFIEREPGHLDNNGPLLLRNRLRDNELNGMIVRGATLTTESVWDDTDIAHILLDAVNVTDFHTFGGLRLESSATESLVVKALGATAGITATGRPLEIDDRIGGIVQVLGQPGFPVVLTSLVDDTEGAGFTPEGVPQVDTNGDGIANPVGGGAPTLPPATGPLLVTANNNAQQLVNGMLFRPVQTGVTIANPVYTGAPTAAGTYINGDSVPLEILSQGIVLSSGNAVLPATNSAPGFTQSNNTPGDAQLSALIGGTPTLDAAVLTFTVDVAANSGIRSGAIDFQFGSDEFPLFVGQFNDVFGVFVNGTNFVRDSLGNLVSINSAFFNIDNQNGGFNIEYNGFTSGLTVAFPLNIGSNTIKIAIADALDTFVDTGALLTDLRFSTQPVTGGVSAIPVPGDWQGITFDTYAHDRNVETILEQEAAIGDGLANAVPQKAQFIGSIGPFEKGGDENLRLGFTVHGLINNTGDADVYSFSGRSGTEIWIDLDRTTHALDSIVELIDNNGIVLARSDNSEAENSGAESLTGLGRKMQKNAPYLGEDLYTTNQRDAAMRVILPGPANTTNTYFIRVRSAPGTIRVTETVAGAPGINELQRISQPSASSGNFTLSFFGQTTAPIPVNASPAAVLAALEALNNIAPGDVVVTSPSQGTWDVSFRQVYASQNVPLLVANGDGLLPGITTGAYQLQVRLRELDEFGGSTVRFAKISNAVNGIHIIGQPTHSPLAGERTEDEGAATTNDTFGTAKFVGNLLNTDRGNMAIAGNLSVFTDVDWYRFEIDFTDFIGDPLEPQPLETLWDTILDMDYADGLARPNTQIYVFDQTGRLILSSRDSNIADDRPGPAPGSQVSDLSRGSQGQADPYIGSMSLPGSVLGATINGVPTIGANHIYFVAVTNAANTPLQLDQASAANATAPLSRLEPLDSVHRIVEDHINEGSFANRLRPDGTPPRRGTSELPTVEVLLDVNSEVPFNLGDVVMYVARDMTGSTAQNNGGIDLTDLLTVDPFTGDNETWVGRTQRDIHDIDLRSDERLYGFAQDVERADGSPTLQDDRSGNYFEFNTGNGTTTLAGDDNILTFEFDNSAPPQVVRAHLVNNVRVGWGIQFNAMTFVDRTMNGNDEFAIAVGTRGEATLPGVINPYIERRRNIIYQMNQDTGAALVGGGGNRGLGAWTDAFEIGEILTQPRIQAPEATIPNTSGSVDAVIRDGQTFDITDGNVTQTFEFESGPEVFQNVDPGLDLGIRDGEFFILDPDTTVAKDEYIFQADSGQTLGVLALNSSTIPDTATFVVNANGNQRTFEFDTNGAVTQGNIAVPIGGAVLSTAGIVQRMVAAIDSQFNATTFPVDAAAGALQTRISFTPTIANGFATTSFGANLVGQLKVFGETNDAPVLEAIDPALIPDGASFIVRQNTTPIRDIRFEFDKDPNPGMITLGSIRVNIGGLTTADQVAQVMATAIAGEGTFDATRFAHRVLVNGPAVDFLFQPTSPEIVDLLDTPANGGLAGRFQIRVEESDLNATIVTNILNAVNTSTATAHFSAFGEAGVTSGARINFPPIAGPNLLAAQALDATGMPRWTLDTSAGFGVQDGNIPIPFGASDAALSIFGTPTTGTTVAQRIGTAINADPVLQAAGISASVRSQFVELTNGFIVNPPGSQLTVAGEGPGGDITGIVQIDANNTTTATFLAISNQGGLYLVRVDYVANQTIPTNNPVPKAAQVTNVDYIGSVAADFEDIQFQGLTLGPPTVEGGRYRETFFAVADTAGFGSQSRLFAFNFDWIADPGEPLAGLPDIDTIVNNPGLVDQRYGGLAPIFLDGQTSVLMFATRVEGGSAVREPLTNARGVVFSNLDTNLWDITPFSPPVPNHRQLEAGHGVNPSPNDSRPTDTGNSSYYFGRGGVGTTYNFPGGAYGSIVSNEFNLTDYSAGDQPVLYFNYFAAQQASQDRLRVFISGIANENRDTNGDGLSDTNSGQWTQLTLSDGGIFTNAGWRQVRIPLNGFVGREGLRLRFDFSTAGEMNVGDLLTTGEELRTVAGEYMTDGQFLRIDHQDGTSQDFEIDLGFSLFTQSGRAIPDGETFRIVGPGGAVTFEFNKPATPNTNPLLNNPLNTEVRINDDQSAAEVAQLVINLINAAGIGVVPRFIDQQLLPDPVVTTLVQGNLATNEVQSIQVIGNPAAGAFTLTFDGQTTTNIPFNAPAAVVRQRLESLSNINPGDVAVTFANATWTVTFQGALGLQNVPELIAVAVAPSTQIVDNWINLKGATSLVRTAAPGAPTPLLTQTGSPGVRAPLAGNRPTITVDLHRAMTRVQVANVLDPLLEDAFTTTSLITQSGVNFRDGQVFELFDGVSTRRYEFESGLLMQLPSTPTGGNPAPPLGVADGDTFTLDPDGPAGPILPETFEMDTDQNFTIGNRQVQFALGNSAAAIANAIVTQVRLRLPTLNARVVALGPTDVRVQFDAPLMTGPTLSQVPADYNPDITFSSIDFVTTGSAAGVAAGNTPVLFSPATNFFSQDISRNITAAINTPIIPPGQPQFPGLLAGFSSSAPSRVNLVSVNNVQLNTALVQPPGVPNPPLVLSVVSSNDLVKQDADLLRIIGRRVERIFDLAGNIVEYQRGPFGLSTDAGPAVLPGDIPDQEVPTPIAPNFDGYRSNLRGQNNTFEGFYLDDIIIGLAERGEMVTHGGNVGVTNTGFNIPVLPTAGLIQTGEYQLEIRRGADYEFVALGNPGFTADSNDRLTEQLTLFAPRGAQLRDGQTFTISDGINRVTFEFNDLSILPNNVVTNVAPGNQRIDFRASDDAHVIARAMRDAINSPQVQATIKTMAQIGDGTLAGNSSTSDRVNLVGPATLQIQGIFAPEINDSLSQATPVSPIGAIYNGAQYFAQGTIGDHPVKSTLRATEDEDIDMFSIVLTANQRIRIDIDARSLGSTFGDLPPNAATHASTLDSVLRIFDANGVELAFSDDDSAPGETPTFDSYLEFRAPAFGTYYIAVNGFGLQDGPPFPQIENPDYNPLTGVIPSGTYSTGFYQLEISSALASSIPNTAFLDQLGDTNQFRDQGQIVLQGNEIRNSSQWGIFIDAGPRVAADGNASHPGAARVLREQNVERLAPGVVVINNLIYNNELGGIRFSGESTTADDNLVPFGRIVNNTLYGQGGSLTGGSQTDVGIRVDESAAPTLMNNIIANFNTGISVDASSQGTALVPRTVLGGMLFQGNDTNSTVGLGGDFPITLANNQPLFVNSSGLNFYLAANSPAIDSSVDSLLDRPALVTVRDPMGIPPSPLLSPDRDGVGQLRVDDPSVSTPQGFGLNPFKDRGAIDRVDFVGPTSALINPPDNDALGTDKDPAPTVVVRSNEIIRTFTIRLLDRFDPNGPPEGSDVDDLTVDSTKVRLETIGSATARVLVEGSDYAFNYDRTNNLIVLTPLGGLWPMGETYRITINNTTATGIKDRAGNTLLPNQLDGTHIYTIFIGSAIDYGDAPDTFKTLKASEGPSHQMVPTIRLGPTIGAEPDGLPSPAANADASDDGISDMVLFPGGATNSSSITVLASYETSAKLDAWLDLNRDGDFEDVGEYVIQGVTLTTPDVPEAVPFTIPNGPRGTTFARFRLSTDGINTPTGHADDGEVEDYQVTLVGPQFQNGDLAQDVNDDTIVSTFDLLIVVNFISTLFSQLDPAGPRYPAVTVPPTDADYLNPVPTFDPTGGGQPGDARYIDVNGDGIVNILDITSVVNYITENFEGEGESGGEGEGESLPMARLAATSESVMIGTSRPTTDDEKQLFAASLLAAPNIILEVRERASISDLGGDWLGGDNEDTLATVAAAAAIDERSVGRVLSLDGYSRRRVPIGPLDDAQWDNLLGELAQDVGGLPGEGEDDA